MVVLSLSDGGAERSISIISKILANYNYEVVIISILDSIHYQYQGKYITLDSKKIKNSFFKKIYKFHKAKKIFKNSNFDLIIDNRTRPVFLKEYIIQKFIYKKTNVIYLVHSYFLKNYFNSKLLSRLLYKKKKIVAVSKEISKKIKIDYGLNNITTIYNSFETNSSNKFEVLDPDLLKEDYILFFGRIDNKSKNLFFLIDAYNLSNLASKKINLLILGKGPDLDNLKNYSKKNSNTNNIYFIPYVKEPFFYVKNALFTVMTSNYEGFPMSIIESMSLGVPVVSLNFKSGPSEIIETGKNGILVNSSKISSFTIALNKMVEDKGFYLKCKSGAKNSIQKFKKNYIGKQWINLIESL